MPPLRNILLKNLGQKTLSLLLAIAVWLSIRQIISNQITLDNVPLVISVDDGVAILNQDVVAVEVDLRGSQEDLQRIDHRQIKAVVDLRGKAPAETAVVPINLSDIRVARGVTAVRVKPASIHVILDHETQKTVPVKGRTVGKPLAGQVEETVCDPVTVILKGPARHLREVEWLFTEPLDVDGRVESFAKRCRVMAPDNTWTPKIEPPDVQVKVLIVEKSESVELTDVPVAAMVRPGQAIKPTLSPQKVNITFTGSSEALAKIKQDGARAFVDCETIKPGMPYDLPVKFHIPPGLELTAVAAPEFIQVTIDAQ